MHALCQTQGWLAETTFLAQGLACVLAFKFTHYPVETFALPFGITEGTLIDTERLFKVMVEVITDLVIAGGLLVLLEGTGLLLLLSGGKLM